MDEREAIVAWVRENADHMSRLERGRTTKMLDQHTALQMRTLADAIERGDHLSKPKQD